MKSRSIRGSVGSGTGLNEEAHIALSCGKMYDHTPRIFELQCGSHVLPSDSVSHGQAVFHLVSRMFHLVSRVFHLVSRVSRVSCLSSYWLQEVGFESQSRDLNLKKLGI